MTINWRNSLWYTCSFPIGLQDAATRRVFSRGFTKKNGACSLDCFTYKSSSSANMSSSLVFHGLFACFPSPFIDGVSWIKYFKRVFVFDVGISGQFFLSFALQRVRHPGEKEDIQQLQQVWQHLTNHVRLHEPITSRQNWLIRSSNDQNPNSDIWQTVVSQCPRGPSFSFCLKNLRPKKRGKNIVLAPHWSKNRKRKKKYKRNTFIWPISHTLTWTNMTQISKYWMTIPGSNYSLRHGLQILKNMSKLIFSGFSFLIRLGLSQS